MRVRGGRRDEEEGADSKGREKNVGKNEEGDEVEGREEMRVRGGRR